MVNASLIAQARGFLELQVGGGLAHAPLEVGDVGLEVVADQVRRALVAGGHEEQEVREAEVRDEAPGRGEPLEVGQLGRAQLGLGAGDLREAGHGILPPAALLHLVHVFAIQLDSSLETFWILVDEELQPVCLCRRKRDRRNGQDGIGLFECLRGDVVLRSGVALFASAKELFGLLARIALGGRERCEVHGRR